MMNNQLQKIIALDDIAYKSGGYVEYLPIKNSENDNFTQLRQYCLKNNIKMSSLTEEQKEEIINNS